MEAIQVAPFVHRWVRWTPRQWLQILFGSLVLLPIRLFGLIILLVGYYVTVKILFRVFSEKSAIKWTRATGKIAAKRLIGRIALLCFGQSVTQRGKFDPSARVLVSNHVSYLDIIWAQSAHCPALVAKEGVQRVPFIGTLARAWQCVWVGGALDGARGVGDASQLVTRVNSDDPSLTPLLVFAEGTTTNGEYLLPFRTGAFVAGQPVQPVVLRFVGLKSKYHSSLFSQGWETIPVWLHLFLSLSQWRTVLEVTYLPLYSPSEQERTSARLYADNVRRVMSERSASTIHPRILELSNATIREKRLFHQLIIKGVYSWRDPFESGIAVVPSGFGAK